MVGGQHVDTFYLWLVRILMHQHAKTKVVFFVISKDYFYCVPWRDMKSADPGSIQVGDEVTFKYNRLTLIGKVNFLSGNEKEVLTEIKREKKSRKAKREESFHATEPRKCVLKQMNLAKERNSKAVEDPDDRKLVAKKSKEQKRARAELLTDTNLQQTDLAKEGVLTAELQSPKYCSDDEVVDDDKSASSVDAKDKVSKAGLNADLLKLTESNREVSDNKSFDLHGETAQQMIQSISSDLDSTLPVETSSECGNPVKKHSRKRERSPSSISHHSTSDSSTSSAERKKRKRQKSKTKRYSSSDSTSSSSDSSPSSSDCSSSEEYHRKKKRHSHKVKKHKKSKKSKSRKHSSHQVKRNLTIYPGTMYRYNESHADEELVRVHPDYDVFVAKTVMEEALRESRSVQLFIKSMVKAVFTKEALKGSTAQGYPNRVLGKHKLHRTEVLPRLDPDGWSAILKRAKDLEESKKSWRPRIGQSAYSQAFSQAVKKCSG